jgi:hypothetical protein
MAHIQKAPVHTHESESKEDLKLVNVNAVASSSNHGRLQSEIKHVDAAKATTTSSSKSEGLAILGFPWQFAVVMGVIAGSVLVIVLRAIGLF